jgi:D-alanyl-D-alanine carboxypeptidase
MVFDAGGSSVSASVGTGANGEQLPADAAIRVGSITKLLTSTTVLSLVDEGLVDLDAPLSRYVSRFDIDDRVTIRDALQHSTGLPEYTDTDGYLPMLVEDPSREWTPEEVFALGRTAQLDFDPGASFAYSNTNYIALGLVIEEITGQAYDQAVRERIIDPLGLSDTYLEHYEEGREPLGGYTGLSGEIEPVAFDFTSIATNEWSAGGMVSSGRDLHRFMSALFAGEIVSPALVTEMTQDPEWGFGIFEPEWSSETPLLGHDGRTLGSGTFLVHAPQTGMTVFTFANADHLKVSPATGDVAEAIGVQGVRLVAGD